MGLGRRIQPKYIMIDTPLTVTQSALVYVGVLLFTGGAAALMAAGIYVGWLHPII